MARKTIEQICAELDELNAIMEKKKHVSDAFLIARSNPMTREKMSKAKQGTIRGPQSQETKKRIGDGNRGKSNMTDAQRNAIIEANKKPRNRVRVHSEETKKKIKEKLASLATYICPHCGLGGRSGVMFKWHFDNCKHK